uniref:Stress-response A/B barrel domain-containing protein n=1 Tax=Haptolina ericina TaxID=156174 RepID=A0A7S3EUC0_9EUKA
MPFILGWNHHANISLLSSSDVNQGFTHGVIVYLKDRADLQRYLEDPQHADIKRLQDPLLDATMVVDFEDDILETLFDRAAEVTAEVVVDGNPPNAKPRKTSAAPAPKRKKPPAPPPAYEPPAASSGTQPAGPPPKRKKIPAPPPAYEPPAAPVLVDAAVDPAEIPGSEGGSGADIKPKPLPKPTEPKEVAPLTLENLKGRVILVPRSCILPGVVEEYGCDEFEGRGWSAKVVSVHSKTATVKWTVKTGTWSGYKDYYKTSDVVTWQPLK